MATEERGSGWRDGTPLPKPTRASLREVKREAKERRRAALRPAKPPKPPKLPSGSHGASRKGVRGGLSILLTVAALGAGIYFLNSDRTPSATSIADDPAAADPVNPQEAAEQREEDRRVDPWEGTDAADWLRGSSGIDPPRPRALSPYSVADVHLALNNAEDYLEAAILDEHVVYRGAVDPVLATLEEPDYLREQYGDPDSGSSWPFLATRFRPNVIGPVGDVVRVRGSMKPAVKGEELVVRFSYAVAYAVRALKDRSEAPQLIVIRREGELRFPYDSAGAIGLPYPGRMDYVSDHSVCGRKWPFPAYTVSWLDQSMKPGDKDVSGKASHDLTNPDDSLKDIKGCFTNTGSL